MAHVLPSIPLPHRERSWRCGRRVMPLPEPSSVWLLWVATPNLVGRDQVFACACRKRGVCRLPKASHCASRHAIARYIRDSVSFLSVPNDALSFFTSQIPVHLIPAKANTLSYTHKLPFLITMRTTMTAIVASTMTAAKEVVAGAAVPVASVEQQDVKSASKGGPQCCHCGWRGAHEPSCPFAS